MNDEIVDVYDFTSKEIRRVPVAELPLYYVRIKIEGIENVCWADPNQLQQGPYQHPPFDAQRRAAIQQIKDGIDEVYPMSLEKWEDGFRRDRNPDSEIAIWLRVVATYRSAIVSPRTLAAKKDIFRILSACTFSTPAHFLESAKLNVLSRDEAASIIADYFSKAGSSPVPPLKVEAAETRGPMEFLKIILLAIGAAILFGILHDQITARVCVEYFTIGHPPVFQTDSPTLLGLGWGIIATCWVGLILGIPMASCARLGARPAIAAKDLFKPIGILLIFMACLSLIAGISGYFAAKAGYVWLLEPMSYKVPTEKHFAFIADLWSHLTAYASGFIGGIVICVRIWRRRKRL